MPDAVLTNARPVDDGVFASLEPPQLLGSRCSSCGTVVFPAAGSCPCCSSEDVVTTALPANGVLWSWTVQRIEPKRPFVAAQDGFEPFAVGYVDLGEVLVESRLVGPVEEFSIGDRLSLMLLPIPEAYEDEGPTVSYAFRHGAPS